MSRRRRNTDEDLRALERRAAAGDTDAQARLVRARLRAGAPGSITLGELAVTPEADVLDVLRALPDDLAGKWWRTQVSRPVGRAYPAMTHDQIMETLGPSARNDYERAVENEAEALAVFRARHTGSRRKRPASQYRAEVQGLYANDISDFLQNPERLLEPHEILSNRRTPIAWAMAELLRRELRAREGPVGRPIGRPGISGALARLFRAEFANHEQMVRDQDEDDEDELPEPTLESAMDSLQQGYDTGHGDDMDAVLMELEQLLNTHGNVEVRQFWSPGDEIPDYEWPGVDSQSGLVSLESARLAAATAAYEEYDFGDEVTEADAWVYGPPNPDDTWRRAVFLNPDGSDAVIFVVQFAHGTADVIEASAP